MNQYQQTMYDDLMALTKDSDTFYYQDVVVGCSLYRIFNYRLSSYSEFMKPSALECRGHMFELVRQPNENTRSTPFCNLGMECGSEYVPIRLAALPMQKFFNINENPMTMNLDLSKVDTVESKADGSLISSYMIEDRLLLKSKGSLTSDQALDAMKWLARPENDRFQSEVYAWSRSGHTVNLEWCAPDNRIVIGYEHPHLKVLNVRSMVDGSYVCRDLLESCFGEHMIPRVDTKGIDVAAFVQSVPDMLDDIEGFVARIGDLWFKIKTNKYLSLHHTKDSINNPRRLYEVILNDGVDDLRSMFHNDVVAIGMMDKMQALVNDLHKKIVHAVETFHLENKHLDRKEYAIKGQAEVDRLYFGLVMAKYLKGAVDYKEFMKSKYKELGIRDEPPALVIEFG